MKNPLHSDKILTYFQDAVNLKQGKMVAPRMALIYPTYLCNHNCPHCLYKGWNDGTHLPFDRFCSLIDELALMGVKGIEFCGGGEPTLYPQLSQIISKIKEAGMDLGILTNGSTLAKYYKLLVDNCKYVRISLDSLNSDTYLKMHGVELGSLPDDIRRTVEYRNKTGRKCAIGIKTLITKDNYMEPFDDFGADYVQEKYARACEGEMDEKKSYLKGTCWLSPIHTMIDPYGDVYICCYYQYREDKHRIGSILQSSFNKIWFSQKHLDAIKNIDPKECNKYDCRFHRYNDYMNEVIYKDSLHINFI